MHSLSREAFDRLAKEGRPVAVFQDILGDMETPLSAYWKLAHDETYSFLLESVTGGEQVARYSFLGVRPRVVLRSKDRHIRRITSDTEQADSLATDEDPLDRLKAEMPDVPTGTDGMPKFCGGSVGILAYDFVRFLERLPDSTSDDLNVDDMAMMITNTVVVFDHAKNLIRIIVLAEPSSAGYDEARREIEHVLDRLSAPLPPLPRTNSPIHPVASNMSREEFENMVRKMKEYITAGDGIQMVPAQRFSTRVDAHPVSVYRSLRSLNPSPYMFLMRFGDFDVVGASPELLVGLSGRTARVRPIAGTRWRGKTHDEDIALEKELLADVKERAEHIMLVDLGRNDLGRVCDYGSVRVNELMTIERYSHVMHIVSDVTGTLKDGYDALDLIRAGFPAGTVTGAPKIRAMEIIDELEPTRRGLYAGAIGYLSATGDLDTAIAIRTILLKNGMAYVQAGGGVVYDSDPAKEFDESFNKAKAALKAIEMAQQGL